MRTLGTRRQLFSRCLCCDSVPLASGGGVSRRNFLAAGAMAGSAAALGLPHLARAAEPEKRRIDVHHHIVPPAQAQALNQARTTKPPKWSVSMSLEDMDQAGVRTAVTSVINPGVWFGEVNEAARKLARECNEFAAKLEQDYPGRFKTFAVIPLPDTEGSLREIEYALDVLKAEGIALWTVYSGKYLGDPSFLPVFEELNRRKAVVYTHPTTPDCCADLVPGVSVSTLEYNHDTTRTIASLVFGKGNTALRCPDIKFIWSHSGGTLPFLTSRFEVLARQRKDQFPEGAVAIFRRFYYEVAQGNTHAMLSGLLDMVPVSQVLFGSDFPYREAIEAVKGIESYPFSDADRRAIYYENAIRLMPDLKEA